MAARVGPDPRRAGRPWWRGAVAQVRSFRRPIALSRLALALFAAASPALARAGTIADPACGEMTVVMRSGTLVYPLPHSFIRAGSDTVSQGARPWSRGVDYRLDRLRGELRLLRDPIPGDTLRVGACWLVSPPPLELQLLRYRPAGSVASESLGLAFAPGAGATPRSGVRPAAARDPAAPPPGASLQLSGNKTIAVDFGSNQDAFLRQSLDLAVSGTLAPGVELTGVLSDRNTPLTEGGSTQSLESLDRVLIELKAPQGGAALGDVSLDLRQGEFARLERRVQGLRGQWSGAGFQGTVAAASAPGEYRRIQFFGTEGRQGPYLLTDRDGGLGISVVAGSEVVTVDGQRMARGESADYSIEYERARLTFTNRRPISSESRITVEYQYTVNRYRRNLVAGGGRWEKQGLFAFVQGLSESDDRGRPLDLTLGVADRLSLEAAGDSASFALGAGVSGGGGDYDTVRVNGGALAFAFTGRGGGEFAVEFARVGSAQGEYADSSVVGGHTAYRFVGPGQGVYRVGRPLPLPESHQLWSAGGGARVGPLALELEGAMSRVDRNLFSRRDDGDNQGGAGRAALRLEGRGPRGGTAGVVFQARSVERRFAPFSLLERPFAEEDWGLPVNADLQHQRRYDATAYFRPRRGGELRASLARLSLPDGFASLRHEVEWAREGALATHLRWERADGDDPARRYGDGGRRRLRGDASVRLGVLEPVVRFESDERRFASDTGRVGERQREAGLELRTGAAAPWRAVAGFTLRRDARATASGFVDQSEARTLRLAAESPAAAALGMGLVYQRRELSPLADTRRTRSDLGGLRLRADDRSRGLTGQLNLEITSEGENRRVRQLIFVGGGRGAYDALGNVVGVGDYDLVVTVSPDLERVARSATSALMAWQVPHAGAWRGTRVGFDFEVEARRRGEARARDPVVSPGAVLGARDLVHGSVLQRFEADVAPASNTRALRLRAERRVTGERAFENFAQTVDDRSVSLRWRGRSNGATSAEVETRLRRQSASQSLTGSASYRRTLIESGGIAQLIYTPDARLRAVAALEASWNRPETEEQSTRTVRLGPDLGLGVGARGRAELGFRRAFVSGPPAAALFPSADPAGAPRWEGSSRFDYRVRESTTLGVSLNARDRRPRPTQVTGRFELRAFF